MRRLAGVAAGAVILAALGAHGQTYNGTYENGEGVGSLSLSAYPDGTTFQFSFSSSVPVTYGTVDYIYQQGFNQYFDVTGMYYGGDNVPINENRMFTGTSYTTVFTTPSDYNVYYPDGDLEENDYFSPDNLNVDVFSNGTDGAPFQFTIYAVTPVPEPGTWAMMFLGLGALGAVFRGRSKVLRCADRTESFQTV